MIEIIIFIVIFSVIILMILIPYILSERSFRKNKAEAKKIGELMVRNIVDCYLCNLGIMGKPEKADSFNKECQ